MLARADFFSALQILYWKIRCFTRCGVWPEIPDEVFRSTPIRRTTMAPNFSLSDPEATASRGENVYREKYKDRYESEYAGKFLAVDVTTDEAYLGDTSEQALRTARDKSPDGLFHLIRIGYRGAFRFSHTVPIRSRSDWRPK